MGVMRARTASFVEKNHINKRWYHSLGHLKPTLKYLHFKIGAKKNFMTKLLACGKDNHNNGIDSLMYEGFFLSNKLAMLWSEVCLRNTVINQYYMKLRGLSPSLVICKHMCLISAAKQQ